MGWLELEAPAFLELDVVGWLELHVVAGLVLDVEMGLLPTLDVVAPFLTDFVPLLISTLDPAGAGLMQLDCWSWIFVASAVLLSVVLVIKFESLS